MITLVEGLVRLLVSDLKKGRFGPADYVLPSASVAPAFLPFEDDPKRVAVLIEGMQGVHKEVVAQLGIFMQGHS